jgi:hypothetical protein
MTKKEYVLKCLIPDLVSDLCYYDRKGCCEVSVEDMETMLEDGTLDKEEMAKAFKDSL